MKTSWQFIGRVMCVAGSAMHLQASDFDDPNADREALPTVPPGFEVSFFAREPMVRQPCSMSFDAKGRLYVGMGPQYRNPKPDTPGDSVVMVLDTDGNGRADRTKTFATGFNAIQGMAWHGRDLWVANSPDLTIVRDLDGDDEADEYVRVYTDLGNLEHGLHGLNWAPDGKLYMSKGNSKGLTQPGRIAPKPFRDLWGVAAPPGSPDFPAPRTYTKDQYHHAYHDPDDDWGREGGVLRCDDGGANLEIIARGFRNPWDIAFDSGFNWLGTDNDQTMGDRVFMPFYGAHFGWNHPWSSHWTAEPHVATAPVSGPLFEGSGTGVVFGNSPQFPESYRGVFFINDWLRKTTFVWRPHWDGALLRPSGGDWELFVRGGKSLFRPTDLEFGPDGALWVLGWSSGYGAEYKNGEMSNEGRIFRIVAKREGSGTADRAKYSKPLAQWTTAELVGAFDGPLPVWRIDAQDELVRRGANIKAELMAMVESRNLNGPRETWVAWTVGRLNPQDKTIDDWLSAKYAAATASLNFKVQTLRILAHRFRQTVGDRELPSTVMSALRSSEPRLRFEAVQAIAQTGQRSAVSLLLEALADERDATVFYGAWQTLRRISETSAQKELLTDSRSGVRAAAILALLEEHRLNEAEVQPLARDPDTRVREIAELWLRKSAAGGEFALVRGRPLNAATTTEAKSFQVGFVREIRARSGARYQLEPGGLRVGAKPYTDRGYELKGVPAPLEGADFIQTANNDDGASAVDWLTFETLVPVRVHVALDTRTQQVPSWIRERFRQTNQRIRADHWIFQLYSREFPAGRVVLGGNTENGMAGGKGNYIVVLEPIPIEPPSSATSIEAAMEKAGDRDRGEWLFHHPAGASCFNCHRLNESGNSFGPDLASLGTRAALRHIVQSIVDANAVITEGYNLRTFETADEEFSGVLIEESDLSVTLGLATGERQVIPKSKIISRKTAAAVSAMPQYDKVLNAQYVADLAKYLSEQKGSSSVSETSHNDFQVNEKSDRLVITSAGQPVAQFVFSDPKILRPYFANLHAPGGLKVTRNHPPLAGSDATDHDTMHPGIWLAFGDINGADFWRNKGRIEHVRFTEAPTVANHQLTFGTECRLVSADGRKLCSLTNFFTLSAKTNAWLLSWDATFRSDEGEITFGDQEEMGFGARVATAITEKNGGIITSSTGLKTAQNTWGQAAEWCDYSGTINGERIGVTLMPYPENFRGSWWHNRDYGVFVANPFGRESMKQGAKSAIVIKRGESLRLRFGALIHAGERFSPAEGYRAYSAR